MKILLPSAAAVLIALVVLWPQIQETGDRFRLGFARSVPDGVDAVRMVKVRYTGVDRDNRPFTITADSATQVGETATRIALRMPQADVTLKGRTWIALTAETGLYARDRRLLDLQGAVNLFHDQGYEMHTERVHFDLATGTAESNETVRGQGPFGELAADGFRIRDQGKTVLFTGKARILLYPQGDAGS